ncbi:MAG TPA: DUF58 domain-containing protein [Bacteroidales bacterium]|nr:DUF58 domain-containing protein [Bacteroidales bacterium]HOL97228.1 DUF58 domain-containing protein [Bacteroidales bacterium]HPD23859.1 DUF58 domain-containing protein [Bacteroidales bacterium]HRS98783.1 DUF58 domain-containing protein [Bacteroidales bacterium]HRT79371.1 DUF58 domain-containing protein [Bacteroidales bacterium]
MKIKILIFAKTAIVEYLSDIEHFPDFDNLEFIAQQVVEGFITGLHKSPYHGFSVEFAEHRIYNKGESTKHIDWKLYARTEKLFVKRYEEETNLRAQIFLDCSSSMLFPYDNKKYNKLIFSIYCSAALIYLLRKQRDAVGLSAFNKEIIFHENAKSNYVHAQVLYNNLRKLINPTNIGLQKNTDISSVIHQLAEIIHKRSLVIIFSDLFFTNKDEVEKFFSSVQHLKYNKHEVIIFQVTDKKLEQEFAFANRPYKFIDLETNNIIKLNPNEIRNIYVERTAELVKEIETKCNQFSIDLIQADINNRFSEVLKSYIIKREKYF